MFCLLNSRFAIIIKVRRFWRTKKKEINMIRTRLLRFLPALLLVMGAVSAHADTGDFSTGVASLQTAAIAFCGGIVAAIFAFGAVQIGIPAAKWVIRTFKGLFSR